MNLTQVICLSYLPSSAVIVNLLNIQLLNGKYWEAPYFYGTPYYYSL